MNTSNRNQLCNLITQPILSELSDLLSQFWLPPHKMGLLALEIAKNHLADIDFKVLISGETSNITLYIISEKEVLAFAPFIDISETILLNEFASCVKEQDKHWCLLHSNPELLQRLNLPKVALINPCVLENFPVPRLSLSVGLLAGYLRKHQMADVYIYDMQMELTIDEIVTDIVRLMPEIIGITVSYGQRNLALSLVSRFFQAKRDGKLSSLLVLGNIIPASFPNEFIEMYPKLIVARGEGEYTLAHLVEYVCGKRKIDDVQNIVYQDDAGQIITNFGDPVDISDLPLPALDTIEDLSRLKGALTLEISRGCQWNVCTFCPREHKSSHWKTFRLDQILDQFKQLNSVCDRFALPKHIFLADEEFVGGMNDGEETERIATLAQRLILEDMGLRFDAAARVDQVYVPKLDLEWHTKRMRMWHQCRQAGLDRLFMGIESGSNTQLQRYGKGIRTDQTIIALRILSALDIPLRFGFITFDPLMKGLKELKENISFLERTDAFMRPVVNVEEIGYETLFRLLTEDEDFVAEQSAQKPIYSGVSYMLSSMEVLINSRYRLMLKNAERLHNKKLVLDEEYPDTNMGRYKISFLDPLIEEISISCQKWIDRHFGLAYATKSLYKTADRTGKKHLMNWMVSYRRISLILIKSLVAVFDNVNVDVHRYFEELTKVESGLSDHLIQLRARRNHTHINVIIIELMNILDKLVSDENTLLEVALSIGEISDTAEHSLRGALDRWYLNAGEWNLINNPLTT